MFLRGISKVRLEKALEEAVNDPELVREATYLLRRLNRNKNTHSERVR
jgi:hypothetical protein